MQWRREREREREEKISGGVESDSSMFVDVGINL